MRVRAIRVIIGVLSGCLLLSGLLAAPAPATILLGPKPLHVYVLRGGDSASDAAVAQALRDAAFEVTLGPETPDFRGSAADLRGFDAVVMLYNQNVARPLDPSGVAALVAYVRAGGGLLSSEWVIWQSGAQNLVDLQAILPASSCGIRSADRSTFRQFSPNPVINAGLPPQFSLELDSFAGSEGCLLAHPDAALLYAATYPGRDDAAALTAWNPPDSSGRVAAIATLLGAAELASLEGRTILQNTVAWIAAGRDLTPPTITEMRLSNTGTIGAGRDLTLTVQAADRGGARLGWLYVAEYIYSGDPQKPWVAVQRSGWQAYGAQARTNLDWQLSADPGVHYLQVFVADTAGNISVMPGLDFVSVLRDADDLATDEVRIYRIRPEAGAQVQLRMQALSGNPDLYVFGDDGTIFAEGLDTPQEEFAFVADGGVYQIEVEGYQRGRYRLLVDGAAPATLDAIGLDTRRRRSIITLSANTPLVSDADLPVSPAIVGPASRGRVIFLPITTRAD